MFIERLNTIGFKNIADVDLSFSAGFNCLTGNNGAGKTNLLDAIYMLSMCKSAFAVNDSQCVRHGGNFFSVKGYYDMDGDTHNVFCNYTQGKKVLKYDGKPYSKLSDHIGLIPVVMISPKDNELIDGMSDVRRKWMDSVISQGKKVGDRVEMGGLLGSAPVMPLHGEGSERFAARGGRIPAPLQSLRN